MISCVSHGAILSAERKSYRYQNVLDLEIQQRPKRKYIRRKVIKDKNFKWVVIDVKAEWTVYAKKHV